jgi:hypothetical protein
LKEFKPFSAGDGELQIPDKFRVMDLADAQEVENFLIKVIQYLDSRRLLVKKNLGSTTERLNVRGVFGDKANDFSGNAVFTAQI